MPFFRSREDQFLVFPHDLPGREFARPNLQACEISLMQAEKVGLGHFPESSLLIRCNVALHPLGDMRACLFPIHAPPHHVPHEMTQRFPMQLFEWIGIAEGLPHGRVTLGRSLIGPDVDILEQVNPVQLIDAQNGVRVGRTRNAGKRQRRQVCLDERNVRRQTRNPLVNIVEGLKVRKMHHGEERLLERVMDCLRSCQHLIKAFLDQLRDFERMEGGAFNADRNPPQTPGRRLIRQEVLRQNSVEVQNRIAVEADLIRRAHKKRDGILVIENHLGFQPVPALRLFAEFDQATGIKQRVCIAFEPA